MTERRLLLDRANGGRWPLFLSSAKAYGYYIDQANPPSASKSNIAAAANPYLTPAGMHVPVSSLDVIPPKSVGAALGPATYSFLQAAAPHFFREELGDPPPKQWRPLSDCSNDAPPTSYDYMEAGSRAVNEESRAIFDPAVYTPDPDGIPLVSAAMRDSVEAETVTRYRGKKKHKRFRWRRTYYRLKDWQCMDYVDYIHKFALRP